MKTQHHQDSRYTIRWTVEDNHCVFQLFEIVGKAVYEDGREELVWDKSHGTTESLEEADVVTRGFIKWDGCSNWRLQEPNPMKHFCGASDLASFHVALQRAYEIAYKELDGEENDDLWSFTADVEAARVVS